MSSNQNPNIKISGEQNPNQKMKSQPYLPELVLHQILLTLPTIPAVTISLLSKQWRAMLSSLPLAILDFDEDKGGGDQLVQHRKFINSLKGCLNYFSREDQKRPVNKLRLHMVYSSPGDATAVDECLMFAIKRSVKELDISLRSNKHEVWPIGSTDVSLLTLLTAEFITALTLDNLILNNRDYEGRVRLPKPAFPFLKTMSLTKVHFECSIMSNLIWNCPSIESLSLDSCSFWWPSRNSDNRSVNISSSTLKYMEVKNYRCIGHNNQHCMLYENAGLFKLKAKNLESFTFDSGYEEQYLDELLLLRCWNLKYLSIHSQCLKKVVLIGGCVDRAMKGTLNAPNLHYLNFSGHMSSMSEFCLEAPNLLEARIQIKDLESAFSWSSEYFSNLIDFLAKFGCSKKITLFVGDVEGLIFPENFRKSMGDPSPILPSSVEEVEVFRRSMARDSELMNSLRWMAPSARIELTKMDVE